LGATAELKAKYPVTIPITISQGKGCVKVITSSITGKVAERGVPCINVNRRCINNECTSNRDTLAAIAKGALAAALGKVKDLVDPSSKELAPFGSVAPAKEAVMVAWDIDTPTPPKSAGSALLYISFNVVVATDDEDKATSMRAALGKADVNTELLNGMKASEEEYIKKSIAQTDDFFVCVGDDPDELEDCTTADVYFGEPDDAYTTPAPVADDDSGSSDAADAALDAKAKSERQAQKLEDERKKNLNKQAQLNEALSAAVKALQVATQAEQDAMDEQASLKLEKSDLTEALEAAKAAEKKAREDLDSASDEDKEEQQEAFDTAALELKEAQGDLEKTEENLKELVKTLAKATAAKETQALEKAKAEKAAEDQLAEGTKQLEKLAEQVENAKREAEVSQKEAEAAKEEAKNDDKADGDDSKDDTAVYAVIAVVGGTLIIALSVVIIVVLKRRGAGAAQSDGRQTYQNPTYGAPGGKPPANQGQAPGNRGPAPVQRVVQRAPAAEDDYDA
jgi:hypothetical protein